MSDLTFSARIGRIVHAFPDKGRKDEIRDLTKLAQQYEVAIELMRRYFAARDHYNIDVLDAAHNRGVTETSVKAALDALTKGQP